MRAYHEIEPVYDENSQILILGSFPSVKSRENHFYYGHPQNRFWKVMEQLYQVTLNDIESKKKFLHDHHIALWDVIESCDIEGSSDASIKNIRLNDVVGLIHKTKIKRIFVNGKKAQKLYEQYLLNKTNIACIVLPSTSPANAVYSMDKLLDAWKTLLE